MSLSVRFTLVGAFAVLLTPCVIAVLAVLIVSGGQAATRGIDVVLSEAAANVVTAAEAAVATGLQATLSFSNATGVAAMLPYATPVSLLCALNRAAYFAERVRLTPWRGGLARFSDASYATIGSTRDGVGAGLARSRTGVWNASIANQGRDEPYDVVTSIYYTNASAGGGPANLLPAPANSTLGRAIPVLGDNTFVDSPLWRFGKTAAGSIRTPNMIGEVSFANFAETVQLPTLDSDNRIILVVFVGAGIFARNATETVLGFVAINFDVEQVGPLLRATLPQTPGSVAFITDARTDRVLVFSSGPSYAVFVPDDPAIRSPVHFRPCFNTAVGNVSVAFVACTYNVSTHAPYALLRAGLPGFKRFRSERLPGSYMARVTDDSGAVFAQDSRLLRVLPRIGNVDLALHTFIAEAPFRDPVEQRLRAAIIIAVLVVVAGAVAGYAALAALTSRIESLAERMHDPLGIEASAVAAAAGIAKWERDESTSRASLLSPSGNPAAEADGAATAAAARGSAASCCCCGNGLGGCGSGVALAEVTTLEAAFADFAAAINALRGFLPGVAHAPVSAAALGADTSGDIEVAACSDSPSLSIVTGEPTLTPPPSAVAALHVVPDAGDAYAAPAASETERATSGVAPAVSTRPKRVRRVAFTDDARVSADEASGQIPREPAAAAASDSSVSAAHRCLACVLNFSGTHSAISHAPLDAAAAAAAAQRSAAIANAVMRLVASTGAHVIDARGDRFVLALLISPRRPSRMARRFIAELLALRVRGGDVASGAAAPGAGSSNPPEFTAGVAAGDVTVLHSIAWVTGGASPSSEAAVAAVAGAGEAGALSRPLTIIGSPIGEAAAVELLMRRHVAKVGHGRLPHVVGMCLATTRSSIDPQFVTMRISLPQAVRLSSRSPRMLRICRIVGAGP
jgi:hypothetical protein